MNFFNGEGGTANLTVGEGEIYATFLVKLCDIVAHLVFILRTSIRKEKLFGDILEIQNIFFFQINLLLKEL